MENKTDKTALLGQYEKLADMLLNDKVHMDGTLGFPEICSWLGADPDSLDALVQEELGMPGDALLRALREGERLDIRRKYSPDAQK